jgi:type IV secretion system protein VirD4
MSALLTLPSYTYVAAFLAFLVVLGTVFLVVRLTMASIGYFFLASWYGLYAAAARLFGWQPHAFGTARWASKRDLKHAGAWNETGLALGSYHGKTVRQPTPALLGIIAPPRSHKSWGFLMPNLRTYKGSAIITDLRGELHAHTGEARLAFGPVFVHDPSSHSSHALNILDCVRWTSEEMTSDVENIVGHLLGAKGSAIGDEFRENAHPLLEAILVDRYEAGQANFPAVVDWMQDPGNTMIEKIESLLQSPNDYVAQGARRTLDMSEKLRQGVWNSIAQELKIFRNPIVRRNTEKSDVLLSELLYGPEVVSLYLTIPFHHVRKLGKYLGLFVEAVVTLVSESQNKATHPLTFFLDEFANLGRCNQLEASASHLQGSGAAAVFVLQNVNQLVDCYGPTSPLLSCIANMIFYCPTPTDIQTSELVSNSLGQATITTTSLTDGIHTSSSTVSEHGRFLLDATEVRRMPKTDAVIFLEQIPPIYCQKLDAPPLTIPQRMMFQIASHPGLCATLAACCFFAWALQPLYHTLQSISLPQLAMTQASPQYAVPQYTAIKPLPSQTLTPAPVTSTGPWVLRATDRNLSGALIEIVQGKFASLELCMTGMEKLYGESVRTMEHQAKTSPIKVQVERQPHQWRWSYQWPGDKAPQTRTVSCKEES